jgi:hypothetical protein
MSGGFCYSTGVNMPKKKIQPRAQNNTFTGGPAAHPARTFEDWQADQQADDRTPEERGLHIGSPVMWRHRSGRVITTERAVILAIEANTLTLQVKDVESRTCTADISEIVTSQTENATSIDAKRRAYYANRAEPGPSTSGSISKEDTPDIGSLTIS